MKILCVFGEYNYGDPSRGQGYEYTNFIPALEWLGHEVVFFESLNKTRYTSFSDLNRSFLSLVERERPDVIVCVLMHYELWLETLEIARGMCNATLINWATDDSWKYRQFSRLIAPHFDIYATTSSAAYERARKDGINNFYLTQWAASGVRLREPLAASDCRHAVSFVGSRYGNRVEWIDGLRQRGIDIACFGHGWKNGVVATEEIPWIMQNSVISLNFGDSERVMNGFSFSRSRQVKARIFEVPGSGGFLLTETAEDLERYFIPGSEVVTFCDMDDLINKITYYLEHSEERNRIARAGHERTRTEHTYEIRFSQLLGAARALQNSRRLAADEVSKAVSASESEVFQKLTWRHRQHAGLRLLRRMLTIPCVLVWGKKRGPRAARRILFELSWRLCGETTYSARGWPGRIFYKES
jgi:spore maturation protein CgeB